MKNSPHWSESGLNHNVEIFCHAKAVDYLHNNIVDGDVNELDKKSNKAHDTESNSGCDCNFLELWKHKPQS